MSTQNRTNTSTNELRTVEELIRAIETKSAGGGYIYRGERECYPKVSSSLYREFSIETENFDIEVVQKEMLTAAKKHTGYLPQDFSTDFTAFQNMDRKNTDEAIDFEILTELQHYGGSTNLIDFTTDYCIALFFACDGSHDKEGRIILQKTKKIRDWIQQPRNPRHRVVGQKSVFVRPPKGFIKPDEDDIVRIPVNLKQPILAYLRNYHGISTETIYNDLHGFIKNQSIHGNAYTWLCRGVACGDRGDKTTTVEEKQKEYAKSIEHYTKAIELKQDFPEAYYNRGNAHLHRDELDQAIEDYNTAIKLNPDDAEAYTGCGVAYNKKGEYDQAIENLSTAIRLNPDYILAYTNRGNAYNNKGKVDKAINDFTKAIELNPDDAVPYFNLGNAYHSKGEYDQAIRNHNMAIQLKSDYADPYNNLGIIYGKQGKYDFAIENFTKAIRLTSGNLNPYYNLGRVYDEKGEYNQAIENYDKVIELNPDYITAYYRRGVAWLHLSEWEKAKSDLTTARNMGIDIGVVFHSGFGSVENFERISGVQLPADIAAMLTPL